MKFIVAALLLVACAVAVFAAEEAPKDKRAVYSATGLGYGAYPYAGGLGYSGYPYAGGLGYGAYPYAGGLGYSGYPYIG